MAPRRKADEDKRKEISVTVPKELVAWVDEMVKERVYASRSHGVELCIKAAREQQQRARK